MHELVSVSLGASPFNFEVSSRVVDNIASLLVKVKQAGAVPLKMVNSKAVDIRYFANTKKEIELFIFFDQRVFKHKYDRCLAIREHLVLLFEASLS